MIIGVAGTNASGKDTVANYLKTKGYANYSLSDIVREECDKRGLPKDRDTLSELANELRRNFGNSVLAGRAMEKIKKDGIAYAASIVITSIRSPEEAATLKRLPDFKLIAVDAPIELRYQRTRERGREGDFISFENFKRQEGLEMTGGAEKQNIRAVMQLADETITNDGTTDELHKKIDGILNPKTPSPGL